MAPWFFDSSFMHVMVPMTEVLVGSQIVVTSHLRMHRIVPDWT